MDIATTSSITASEIIILVERIASLNLGYLGISVTIIALLGGAFYLLNFKPLKDTLENQKKSLTDLKNEVEENLSSSKEELKKDLKCFEETNTKDISSLVQQKNEKLISDIKTKIAIFEKDFTEKFNTFVDKKDQDLKTVLLSEFGSQIRILEKALNIEINNNKKNLENKITIIQSTSSSLKQDISKIKEDLIDLQIEYHLNKNQIGAMRKMLEKLSLSIKKKWGVEDVLLEIKEYIKKHGMPNVYLSDLTESLKEVSEDHKIIKNEILELASEKVYKL